MKQSKTTGKKSKGQPKDKSNNWKNKAVKRRKEIERLKKRVRELTESRDNWKSKWEDRGKQGIKEGIKSGAKASRHRYSLELNVLVVALSRYGGMSLRCCRHCLCCLFICLGLEGKAPSHSTVRIWLCKCGVYRIEKEVRKGRRYVIFVDESISFGSEKILLILGVPTECIPWEGSLRHGDMEVLYVGVSQEWKGHHIGAEIAKIAGHNTIDYAVSDQGNNLKKSYKCLNINHIEDCTHVFANDLKRIYDKDEVFEAFRKLIGKLRQKWNLSKDKSRYMPPMMRGKMRFANIFPCVDWAQEMLQGWDGLGQEVQQALVFLQVHKDFIETLVQIAQIFKTVCARLKNNGFSLAQKQEIEDELEQIDPKGNTAIFIQNCKDYLENLAQKSRLLGLEKLLCSSDIIESYFGKFKNKIYPNSTKKLTEFVFTIATFGKDFSKEDVKKALESVRCDDLVLVKREPDLKTKIRGRNSP